MNFANRPAEQQEINDEYLNDAKINGLLVD
jgi:hypothetical protein